MKIFQVVQEKTLLFVGCSAMGHHSPVTSLFPREQ